MQCRYSINSQWITWQTDPTEKENLNNAFELGIHSNKPTSAIQLGMVCPQRLKLLNWVDGSSVGSADQ